MLEYSLTFHTNMLARFINYIQWNPSKNNPEMISFLRKCLVPEVYKDTSLMWTLSSVPLVSRLEVNIPHNLRRDVVGSAQHRVGFRTSG